MKVLICGDSHGLFNDLMDLVIEKGPDLVIVCGDFGFFMKINWIAKNIAELSDFLVDNDVELWFVKGNHEDHNALDAVVSVPALTPIMPNVYYASNGYVAQVGKRNVLFMGGAKSIDKEYRTEGYDWFPQELITDEDIKSCEDKSYDTVISHTAPLEFNVVGTIFGNYDFSPDPSRGYLSQILKVGQPQHWFFGHWHQYCNGRYIHDGNTCMWCCLNIVGTSNGYVIEEW